MWKGYKSWQEWISAAKQRFPFVTEQLYAWYLRDRTVCTRLAVMKVKPFKSQRGWETDS